MRFEDNIKTCLRDTGWGDMDWIDVAQDKGTLAGSVITVMNRRVPENIRKFLNC
jgi:hypothetical protein